MTEQDIPTRFWDRSAGRIIKALVSPKAVVLALACYGGLLYWNGPPPWSGKDDCALARFAFERYGQYTNRKTFEDFIRAGVGFWPTNRDDWLRVLLVGEWRNGSEFAEESYLRYSWTTGRVSPEGTASVSPEFVRRNAVDPKSCL